MSEPQSPYKALSPEEQNGLGYGSARVDRFDPAILCRYRLVPMTSIPEGAFIWCAGSNALAVSTPNKHTEAPPHTDTVCLSINDYRSVTNAIADAEEL